MLKNKELLDLINSILLSVKKSDQISYLSKDELFTSIFGGISAPNEIIPLTTDAQAAIRSISKHIIDKNNLYNRIGPNEIDRIVKNSILNLIKAANAPISDSESQKFISRTGKQARDSLDNYTFYIPFELWSDAIDDDFVFGGIRFIERKKIELNAIMSESDIDKDIITEILNSFGRFNKFSEINVLGFTNECGYILAQEIAKFLASLLRIIVGFPHAKYISPVSIFPEPASTNYLGKHKDGFCYSYSPERRNPREFGGDWKEFQRSDYFLSFSKFASIVAYKMSSGSPISPFAKLIRDSVILFGDATCERNKNFEFLKYMCTIEYLTNFGIYSDGDISNTLATRTAVLHHGIADKAGFEECKKNFKRLYKLRSYIIHSGARYNIENEDLREMYSMSRLTIIRAIEFIYFYDFLSDDIKIESIKLKMDHISSIASMS